MDGSGKPTQQGFEFLDRLQSLVKQLNAVTNIFNGLTATQSAALIAPVLPPFAAPTYQIFTGGSGNYVPSAGVVRSKVRMIAGGGGGGAAATNAGSPGTDTSFGAWTAVHGNGGGLGAAGIALGGDGGTGGANGTGTPIVRSSGAPGGLGTVTPPWSGFGGCARFGGGGKGVAGSTTGVTAKANSGAGGGGGSAAGGTPGGGGGGGEGEYVEFIVASPGTIAYAVGGGGNGGAAGTQAGGNGGSGIIIVEEFYV
jgi:hypothetical protein